VQTMLTVLTQMPLFVSGNRSCHTGGPAPLPWRISTAGRAHSVGSMKFLRGRTECAPEVLEVSLHEDNAVEAGQVELLSDLGTNDARGIIPLVVERYIKPATDDVQFSICQFAQFLGTPLRQCTLDA
jgi:hypothetical protein